MTPSTLLHPLKLDVVGFQEDEHDYHFRVELPEPKCCPRRSRKLKHNLSSGKDMLYSTATDPRELKAAGYPVGPDNDQHILAAVQGAGAVCVAWGENDKGLPRAMEVLELLRATGRRLNCLATTKHGRPAHPLMLSAACRLRPFQG